MAVGQGGYYTNNVPIATADQIGGNELVAVDTQSAGGSVPQTLAVPLSLLALGGGIQTGLTAQADGTKANATPLNLGVNAVTVVAGAADSVLLPLGFVGATVTVINTVATAIQVFGAGTDTINAAATGTGVSQAASKTATYVCYNVTAGGVGQWWQTVSA